MGQAIIIIIAVLCGLGIGVFVGKLLARDAARADFESRLAQSQQRATAAEASIPELRNQIKSKEAEMAELRGRLESEMTSRATAESTLAEERKRLEEQRLMFTEAQDKLKDAFQSLAAQALSTNNQSFLELAKSTLEKYQTDARRDLQEREKAVENLVSPIKTSLEKVDAQIREIESDRAEAYGSLTTLLTSLAGTQDKLVNALRTPHVRGRWGEIQLRRVVEMADMINYCDFEEQVSVDTDDGRLRPDLIVKLPGGKNVVVDAKAPSQAYFDCLQATDEEHHRALLLQHARQIREHMDKLGSKSYSDQFQPTPEFVVMFLPGESFFSAALESDPSLIEKGVSQKVIPASPTTLIALLRAVAYGWTQEKLAKNAQEISALGKELHDRLFNYASHMESVGKSLDRAVDQYNKAVRSLESRVMVSARRFVELGPAVANQLPEFEQVEKVTHKLQTSEQLELAASAGSDT